mmetsp:Transcript_132183/g.240449  ORF Transcript_132183/g.240449 Transcript_132183/m.240449 type:complete len:208 (-) Transcript_132183:21-644(-)
MRNHAIPMPGLHSIRMPGLLLGTLRLLQLHANSVAIEEFHAQFTDDLPEERSEDCPSFIPEERVSLIQGPLHVERIILTEDDVELSTSGSGNLSANGNSSANKSAPQRQKLSTDNATSVPRADRVEHQFESNKVELTSQGVAGPTDNKIAQGGSQHFLNNWVKAAAPSRTEAFLHYLPEMVIVVTIVLMQVLVLCCGLNNFKKPQEG